MTPESRPGRPKVSSQATIAEAACELFLEQGYEATTVADIARRVGVSRSSFFNYFSSKADVLWFGLDERIVRAASSLESLGKGATGEAVRGILVLIVDDFAPDPLVLALRNTEAMALEAELIRDLGGRHARLAAAIAAAAMASGIEVVKSDILGAAHAAAVLSSLRVWAEQGAGLGTPEGVLREALGAIHELPWGD